MTVSDFALQLKQGTKKSHTMAENTAFVSSFLRGVVSQESYRVLIANFYFVYRAMEEEIYKLKDEYTFPLHDKLLNRTNKLELDCQYYFGDDWRTIIQPSDATQQYVNRIREVAKDSPYLLVGHHYTRYMGDLSGGQILEGIAKNALNTNGEGLNFYQFDIDNKKEYKDQYRQTLNELPIDIHDANAIIVEANYAFRLNMYMFDELKGNEFKSIFKLLCSLVKRNG